jgi:HSP20 family molecular chaperone IbpA
MFTTHYRINNDLLDLFDQLWYGTPAENASTMYSEQVKDDGTLVMLIDLPGCKVNDIQVMNEGNVVRVKAKRGQKNIERIVSVKKGYDSSTAVASIEDGVLTIVMKQFESAKPKNIPVLDLSKRVAK